MIFYKELKKCVDWFTLRVMSLGSIFESAVSTTCSFPLPVTVKTRFWSFWQAKNRGTAALSFKCKFAEGSNLNLKKFSRSSSNWTIKK